LAEALCTGELESVTFTVNEAVPAVVGVPLTTPPLLSVNPVGNAPEMTDQLYGLVPPLAAGVAAYTACTVPEGKEPTVMASGAGGGIDCARDFELSTPAHPDKPTAASKKELSETKPTQRRIFGFPKLLRIVVILGSAVEIY
jgi:hypothetical protein